MPRARRGFKARQRRNKVLKMAKGYVGGRRKLYRTAVDSVQRALVFAYRDRKVKKREFRKLWIVRINAAVREHGVSYSRFIDGLNKSKVALDRKVLSELAISDPAGFAKVVELAKQTA
ncbi:MAG: 50S ribosomal protein L20 [Desulfarculaceae bacterium]|nr:50S ribosomal protein L20 [Desulfarculaceae bacterium]MCF8048778.1 50S ribosomal protein L20 [Desulfarculaceae bacterium]MCF8065762.1 50S ribosomal protein L20 [Desulfarculaceae bacterium]MCF8096965.1 50S ribosomal protein L20 [Desulfarculaceae bacterium]MCF8122659.1 50S ribosomal protein L20 [Desulfarculaceae bacterium]